jgi:hypothetical protein
MDHNHSWHGTAISRAALDLYPSGSDDRVLLEVAADIGPEILL